MHIFVGKRNDPTWKFDSPAIITLFKIYQDNQDFLMNFGELLKKIMIIGDEEFNYQYLCEDKEVIQPNVIYEVYIW